MSDVALRSPGCPTCRGLLLPNPGDDKYPWRCSLCGSGWTDDSPDDPFPAPAPTFEAMVEELAALEADAAALIAADHTAGTAVVSVAERAPLAKRQMAEARSLLLSRKVEIQALRKSMERRMKAEMERIASVVGPLQKQVALLEEGIWTINLYLGSSEEIVTLVEGDPAPADTPIHVRQLVLYMDEEHRIGAEDGGIDGLDRGSIQAFDQWLTSSPAHLEQVLPEPRGIVVLSPSRQRRRHEEPWKEEASAKANAQSYWLVRNGGCLYRFTTNLNVGGNLIPTKDEFTSFFKERPFGGGDPRPLVPGSREWARAEEAADARRRHFMRTALILQGIVDRTALLAPLPAEGISLLQPESYDAGHIIVITDAEVALGTGRTPYRQWIVGLNARLRAGMRIVGAFDSEGWRAHRIDDKYRSGHYRMSPADANYPASGVVHVIEEKQGSNLIIRWKRTDKRWGYENEGAGRWARGPWGEYEYKIRASAKLRPEDDFIIPIDLVTVAELEDYLQARTERQNYVSLVPLIKSAIKAKNEEAAEEAPFRQMLVGALLADGHDLAWAEDEIGGLVDWWKLKNRHHRALVSGDTALEAKATNEIVAHARKLAGAAAVAPDAIAKVREVAPDAIAIFAKPDGNIVAFSPSEPGANVFVNKVTLRPRSTVREEWKLPGTACNSWRLLWSADAWAKWDHAPNLFTHLTGPEIEAAIAEIAVHQFHRRIYRNEDPTPSGPLLTVDWDPIKRQFLAVTAPTEYPLIPPAEEALTSTWGSRHDWDLSRWKITWKRKGSDVVLQFPTYSDTWNEAGRWPWEAIPPGGSRRGWGHSSVGPKGIPAARYVDQGAVDRWLDICNVWTAAEESWGPYRRLAAAIVADVEQQWDDFVLAATYAKFLDDYVDPGLWPDHSKALQLRRCPTLDVNRYRSSFRHDEPDHDLSWLVRRLLEQRLLVAPTSVADAYGLIDEKVPPGLDRISTLTINPEPPSIFEADDEEEPDDD